MTDGLSIDGIRNWMRLWNLREFKCTRLVMQLIKALKQLWTHTLDLGLNWNGSAIVSGMNLRRIQDEENGKEFSEETGNVSSVSYFLTVSFCIHTFFHNPVHSFPSFLWICLWGSQQYTFYININYIVNLDLGGIKINKQKSIFTLL